MKTAGKPVLSVVIPVYNGEKYIDETIKYVLDLADIAFEVLLIDDGSMDGSAAVCKAHAARDARVRYIYQENAGIASARNRGLALAQGQYVCFWDQDDIPLSDGVAALLSKLQKEDAQMGICSSSRLISSGMTSYERLHDAVYLGDAVRDKLLYPLLFRGYDYPFAASEDYFYGSVWKCIFSLDFVRKNGIRFERFADFEDDWIFVTHALCKAERAVTSETAGYCWRVNRDSKSHRARFISDLPERFAKLDEYVSSYMYSGMTDREVQQAYRQVTLCDHYVELVRNDAGRKMADPADRKAYRDAVQAYLRETDYRTSLKARKHLKNSAHRKKLILVIIAIAGIRIAYIMSKVYDVMERKLERSPWITGLERKRKISDR